MTIPTIATAPVSFGVFGTIPSELDPARLLDAIAGAGFTATELGPPGMLGTPDEAAQALSAAGLAAAGAYVPFHFASDDGMFDAELAALDRTLDELVACGTPGTLAILADEGDERLRRTPRRGAVSNLGWTAAQWTLAAKRIERAADHARSRGITPSFHPHLTTFVEQEHEVDELLRRTSVDLTIDSAHFLLGGMDPAEQLRVRRARVNHLHVKDVDLDAVPSNETAARCDVDDWWGDLSTPLGAGHVDLAAFLDAAAEVEVRWIVIEQDRDPLTADALAAAAAGERGNRIWLHDQLGRRSGRGNAGRAEHHA